MIFVEVICVYEMKKQVKRLQIGSEVSFTLINGKEHRGTIHSLEETLVVLHTNVGGMISIIYDLIGACDAHTLEPKKITSTTQIPSSELVKPNIDNAAHSAMNPVLKDSVAIATPTEMKRPIIHENAQNQNDATLPISTDAPSEPFEQDRLRIRQRFEQAFDIYDIIDSFKSQKIIGKYLPLIDTYENAKRINETDERYGRISRIIGQIRSDISNPVVQTIFSAIVSATGEVSYAEKINELLKDVIDGTSCKNAILTTMIGRLARIASSYDVVFCLAENCQDKSNQDAIELFIYLLSLRKVDPIFKNIINLFTAENFDSLYNQIKLEAPKLLAEKNQRRLSIVKKTDPALQTDSERPIIKYPKKHSWKNLSESELLKYASPDELLEIAKGHEKVLKDNVSDSAVFKLFNIYLKLKEMGKAKALIDRYVNDSRISKEKINYSYIQIYEIQKDIASLIPCYEKAIKVTPKLQTKATYKLRMADLLMSVKQYEQAILKYTEAVKFGYQATDVHKQNLALCYYHTGQKEKAKITAKELLRSDANNIIANGIVKDDLARTQEQEIEETVTESELSELLNIELISERLGELSEYVKWRIDKIVFKDIMKLKEVDNSGNYIGSPKQANEYINLLIKGGIGVPAKIRSEKLLCASKIAFQTVDLHTGAEDILLKYKITKLVAKVYAARAMSFLGDYYAQDMDAPQDTARYTYHQALSLFRAHDKEEAIINAFYRCLSSYLYNKAELSDIVRRQIEKNQNKADQSFGFSNKSAISPEEFALGLLMLLKSIKGNTSLYDKLKHDIYSNNALLTQTSVGFDRLGLANHCADSLNEFSDICDNAVSRLDEINNAIENDLNDCVQRIFQSTATENALERLNETARKIWLNETDKRRLSDITQIFGIARSYHQVSKSFEDKSEDLTRMRNNVDKLCAQIENYPTQLSFDVFLVRLHSLKKRINEELIKLYSEMLPKLSISHTTGSEAYINHGKIDAHLSITNDIGCQTADDIKVGVAGSYNIAITRSASDNLHGVKGGSTEEAILSLKLPNDIINEKACDIDFEISYRYSVCNENGELETVDETMKETLTINLYQDDKFSEINNPYAGHEGNPMKKKELFVGRDKLIDRLVLQIRDKTGFFSRGHSVALFGQTRAGKSSILYHCKEKIKEKYGDDVIVVDYGSMGETGSFKEFQHRFLYQIQKELEEQHIDIWNMLRDKYATLSDNLLKNPETGSMLFSRFLRDLDTILKTGVHDRVIVLLIDEFTYLHSWIKEGTLWSDFMKYWKAIMQNYGMYAIVVGQDNMPDFRKENQNEFGSMELEHISYLQERYAKDLMDKPIQLINSISGVSESRYKQGALDRLFELTAGSAYLIVILCSELVKYLNEIRSIYITRAIIDQFLREWVFKNERVSETTFEPQIKDRAKPYPNVEEINRKILLKIARGSYSSKRVEIGDLICYGIPDDELKTAIERLVTRKVVNRIENKYYQIEVLLLKEWLLYRYGQEE
jgi:tetratricopeptide (TPR) repeat protein